MPYGRLNRSHWENQRVITRGKLYKRLRAFFVAVKLFISTENNLSESSSYNNNHYLRLGKKCLYKSTECWIIPPRSGPINRRDVYSLRFI